jgi:hypothetical protein
LLATLSLIASTSLARQYQVTKGSRDDLKGVTTVYVDAREDALRTLVADELRRQLPQLAQVSSPEDGELVVRFSTALGTKPPDVDPQVAGPRPDNSRMNGPVGEPRGDVFKNQSEVIGGHRYSTYEGGTMQVGPVRDSDSAPSIPPRPRRSLERHAFGSVLKPADASSFVKIVDFSRTLWRPSDVEAAAKGFVSKLAKEYRKANGVK